MTTKTKRKGSPEGLAGDKYFNLIEHAADGIAIIQDGVFKLVNTAMVRISGYDKEELLGMLFTKLLTPQSQKLTMERYQARLTGKKVPQVYEIQAVTKNGQIRDIEINAALTEYEGRTADEVIIRDITERKQAEAAIIRAEQEKTDILNSMSEIVIFQDLKHRMLWVNKVASESAGLTHEQMLGRHCYEVWSQRNKPCVGCPMAKARQTGKPQKAEITTPDGRTWSIRGYPILDENGVITGMLEVALDLTGRKQAEQALQTEKNKLQSVIDALEDNLGIQDKHYNIIYQNGPSKANFGDHLGEKCYRAYEGRDKICRGCPVAKAFKDGKSHTSDRRVVLPSGEVTFWENTANPIRNARGEVVSCIEIGRNVTERKQASEALADEATRRHILVDQSLDGIVVLDENAKVYEANQKFAEMLGYTPEEVRELHTWDWDTQWSREELLEMGRKVDATGFQVETYHRRKDGSTIDVEISINGAVVTGQKLVFCVCRDITRRKLAEDALRESEERYRAVIEGAHDMIQSCALDGSINFVNQAWLDTLGYTKADLPSLNLSKVIHPDSLPHCQEMSKKVAKGEPVHNMQATFLTKDGREILVEGNAAPRYIGDKVVATQGIFHNITERKKAEQALRESEQKYRTIFENVSDVIIRLDRYGKIVDINGRAEECFGYKPEEVIGKNFAKIGVISLKDLPKMVKLFAEVVRGNHAPTTLETEAKRKDGSPVPVEVTTALVKKDGKIEGTVAIIRDITERKKAEEELRKSEERFRTASQIASDVVYERDLQTGIATFYGDIDSHLGYEPGEYPCTMEGWRENVHPEDLAGIDRQSIDQMEPGVPHSIEYRMRKKDGTYITWWDRIILIRDEETGKPIKFIGAATDITNRKNMEKQLQEKNEELDAQNEELRAINEELRATEEELQHSQERLERMFESVTDGIVVAATNGTILKVNQSAVQMHGFATEDELMGKNALELSAPRDREKITQNMRRALKEGTLSGVECNLLKADGSEFPAELSTSVLKNASGKVIGHITTVRDITERQQAEKREDQLEQELNLASRLASIGQLAAGVAHEINNPLTGVIGFSHLMLSRDIPDDMKQDLQVIHSEAQRVAKIVENLLVFAHQRKAGREYITINDIITRVLELRAYEMKVNNIDVESQLAPNLPLTMADAGQLQQVFLNIVLNAEYFMTKAHNKGQLVAKTEKIDGNIRISFTDDGAGISPENLDKIFNPFFTTKEVGKGTGLGLSICHGIITQHKGRIYAQSQPGKGATFVIELPIVAEPAQAGKAKVTKKEPQKSRGAKILVVDDEAAILTFLSRLLTEWGHSVETINNADTALERLRTERYSLVLLDIKLPGMSGIELYHHIEEIAPALARRVMFVTGDVMQSATRSFLEKTGAPYITKPLDIEVLKKTINRALNQTQVTAKASG